MRRQVLGVGQRDHVTRNVFQCRLGVVDDVDAALACGLLDALPCPSCSVDCNAALAEARDARRVALAARDRFVARNARLQRRKAEREAARRPPPGVASTQAAALPSAAADALARALAKAKERRG